MAGTGQLPNPAPYTHLVTFRSRLLRELWSEHECTSPDSVAGLSPQRRRVAASFTASPIPQLLCSWLPHTGMPRRTSHVRT